MITHQVTNQAPPLVDHDASDAPVIGEALTRAGADAARADLTRIGRLAGSAQAQTWGDLAEANQPVLRTHDRYGNRIDEVEYDPAYHALMSTAFEKAMHASVWADTDPNAHLIRAAKFGVWQIVDAGRGCPVSMSYSAVPRFAPILSSPHCMSRCSPVAQFRCAG